MNEFGGPQVWDGQGLEMGQGVMDDGYDMGKTPGGGQGMAVLDFYGNQGPQEDDGIYEAKTVDTNAAGGPGGRRKKKKLYDAEGNELPPAKANQVSPDPRTKLARKNAEADGMLDGPAGVYDIRNKINGEIGDMMAE